MSVLDKISALVKEPPPAYAFEVSEGGVAAARGGEIEFARLPEGTLAVNPLRDNVQNASDFSRAVAALYPATQKNKRRAAALILPDFCARVQVLDFDSFPAKAEEQLQLIRFRVKKTTPFDIDSAAISYHAQAGSGKVDVIVAIVSLEILARYESPFRAAGYHPGYITTSGLAALNLLPGEGVTVFAKVTGRALSVIVLEAAHVKLIRSVELESLDSEAVLAVLHPTLAYIEDELRTNATRLVLCGFGEHAALWGPLWEAELGLAVEPARSRFGTPGPFDAGLLGYLQDGGGA